MREIRVGDLISFRNSRGTRSYAVIKKIENDHYSGDYCDTKEEARSSNAPLSGHGCMCKADIKQYDIRIENKRSLRL